MNDYAGSNTVSGLLERGRPVGTCGMSSCGGTNQALSDLEQQQKERTSFLYLWFDMSESPTEETLQLNLMTCQAGVGNVQPEVFTLDCAKMGSRLLGCFPATDCHFLFKVKLD